MTGFGRRKANKYSEHYSTNSEQQYNYRQQTGMTICDIQFTSLFLLHV